MQVLNTGTTEAGNTYTETFYSEPCPGMKGTDTISEKCGFCLGTGVYQGKSGLTFHTPAVGGVDKGCFHCMGTGKHTRKVSSIRAAARRAVKAANQRAAAAADWEATREAREAQELQDSLEEAYAENERLSSLSEGFWGEEGEQVTEDKATVTKSTTYEGYSYMGAEELKGLVIFTNRAGQPAIYFTTTTNAAKFEEGQTYSVTATVKRHGKDRDGEADQTTLTRVKIRK